MERVMREARLRELTKGVYSLSHGEAVADKVCVSFYQNILEINRIKKTIGQ